MKKNLRKKSEAGFTLIELGIVIAVIAILATVVLVGKGFIDSSKVSKAVDAVDVLRKAASTISGVSGGHFAATSGGDEMPGLINRGYAQDNGSGDWDAVGTDYTVTQVEWTSDTAGAPANRVGLQVTCPAGFCQDLVNAFVNDPNYIIDGSTAGGTPLTCSTAGGIDGTTTSVVLCFGV